MKSLRSYIVEAKREKKAVGHFNFSNVEGLWAIAHAAKEVGVPVIVGVSEGEQDAVGLNQAVALVKAIRSDLNIPIFLNADHHYSVESVKRAIDAGFDSVIFDGAKLSLEENIAQSKECVSYARACGRDVLVEVELGYIGQSSKVLDGVPEGVSLDTLTTPEDAVRLMKETGADMLAPAVGNIHGMFKGGIDPRLDIQRIKKISEVTNAPLVLHGGSGNDADFDAAIDSGMCVVHVNTELRKAYTDGVKSYMDEHPEDVAPYKYGEAGKEAMQRVVEEKLRVFSRIK
ncbi:MAG: Ketose-bisphosphate aldolase [Patescibacteria group bacterium]|jgi:fructose-bisphosphate aldolase class II|nr:Ketose-bisphosphate aldolase [Patescibacteria group bacterium]